MQSIVEKYVQTKESNIHILAAGAPGGCDIIMLHGMKFQAETWRELNTLDRLAAAGHRVLALDMPGFGKSAASSEQPASVLKEVIAREKLTNPVLIGPTMGGRICLEFAIDNPELVGGLVLVGAVGVRENKDRLAGIKISCLIIWGGNDRDGFHSSHRIIWVAHNTGYSIYGPPTGRRVVRQGIAHCFVKENYVVEEWICRDELAVIRQLGFDEHQLAQKMAARMLEEGIYVVGFSFPVVPRGQARIRTQMSAAHTRQHLDRAIDAFVRVGRELGVIGTTS